MKKNTFAFLAIFLAIAALSSLSSCISSRKLTYFNNIPRDSTSQIEVQKLETRIGISDILQINISTPDVATTSILNSNVAMTASGLQGSGYLVDQSGTIKLPLVGLIRADGLTKIQLADSITKVLLIKKIALNPIVNVRILNYKITVLGEVNRPGVYPVLNEHMTLPEALGTAGDLTAFGKRDNVLLIREQDGKRVYKRFSLNNSELFNKDIYNLQNQDIIYIEPNSARAATADRTSQLVPYIFSTVSLLLAIYLNLVKR